MGKQVRLKMEVRVHVLSRDANGLHSVGLQVPIRVVMRLDLRSG